MHQIIPKKQGKMKQYQHYGLPLTGTLNNSFTMYTQILNVLTLNYCSLAVSACLREVRVEVELCEPQNCIYTNNYEPDH